MKVKLLVALMSAIILFTGCTEHDAKEGTISENGENTVCNEPIDDSEFNKDELFYINIARALYIVHIEIEDCCTELDKADVFSWIISTDIYEDQVEKWLDENDGHYKIPLEDIEEIVFTRLDTDTFDPVVAFKHYNKTYRGYDSCSNGTYGYDIRNEQYIPRIIGGYGGAAALGVLQFEEEDNTIKVVLGSYDMNKFYSDTPEYVLGCKYTVTFFNDTDNVENYKILSVTNEFMDDKVHQIITPEGDRIPLRMFDYNYISELGSLINCDDWNDPTEIEGYMLVDYYREYLESKGKLEKQYFMEDSGGVFFPQDEFESFIVKYLDISTEYMQNTYEVYDESMMGYLFEGEVTGTTYSTNIVNVEQEDNIVKVLLDVFYYDGETKVEVGQKELTIELKPNLEFLFTSFRTI